MQKALIALDSKQLTVILKKMLADFGFDCICVGTVEQLITDMSENKPTILFTDWSFSNQKMTDVLPELSPKPIVIFISKEKSAKLIEQALDLGVNEYIMKPFDNDILQSKLSLVGVL